MQGTLGSISCFAWLFIFSEILFLDSCETKQLTFLPGVFCLLIVWMAIDTRQVSILTVSYTQSSHRSILIIRSSGSFNKKDLIFASHWGIIMVPATSWCHGILYLFSREHTYLFRFNSDYTYYQSWGKWEILKLFTERSQLNKLQFVSWAEHPDV